MSEVNEWYELYKKYGGDAFPEWDEEVLKIVRSDPKELNILINLFENEKDDFFKFNLAIILAYFNYKQAIPSLEKVLNSNDGEKFMALAALAQMNEPIAREAANKSIEKDPKNVCRIISELYEYDSHMVKEMIKELRKKLDEFEKAGIDVLSF